ncbi:MAG: hypothetical protein PHX21_13140 [bacterium]|nr:hypothetical protein [bacterium]
MDLKLLVVGGVYKSHMSGRIAIVDSIDITKQEVRWHLSSPRSHDERGDLYLPLDEFLSQYDPSLRQLRKKSPKGVIQC